MQINTTTSANPGTLYFTKRLTNCLASILLGPLTLVDAPMGYGKTVAVREYLRGCKKHVLWVTVLGNSKAAFWREFCRELEQNFPECNDITQSLQQLGYPYDSTRVEEARELLLLLPFAQNNILVVDDYHLLSHQETNSSTESAESAESAEKDTTSHNVHNNFQGFGALCELLACDQRNSLCMVLISRNSYMGNKEILELKGKLQHIGREAFMLSPEEILEYYARCGVYISKDDAALLHHVTGGWISALYLYLLRFLQEGKLTHPESISALVEKEVYAPLSPALKELLFAVAPLERFSASQAAFLLAANHTKNSHNAIHTLSPDTPNSPNAQTINELLKELCQKNSFAVYDAQTRSFALHSIFKQYLRELFEHLPLPQQQALHHACGDWFIQNGEVVLGIKSYWASGDFDKAVQVLENDMSKNLVTENVAFFMDMFKACPAEVLDRHLAAAFKYAIAAFGASDYPTFGAQCAWLAKKCDSLPASNKPGGKEADIWRGELEFLYSLMAYNDIAAMSIHHKKANALMGRPTRLFGGDSPWTLGSPSVLLMFHRESGKLAKELQLMKECLPHYYTLAANHGFGGEYLMEAEALYNAGDFENAAITCHKAEVLANKHNQLSNVLCALFLHMRLAFVAGDFEQAQQLLGKMRGLIKTQRDYFLLHTVELCEGWLYAALGQIENIPLWLRTDISSDSRLYAFAKGCYFLIHGRILLLSGNCTKVIGMLAGLLEAGVFRNHLFFQIHAHLFIAAARHGLGQKEVAVSELTKALEMALPDKLYMPFVENFDLLEPLLQSDVLGKAFFHKNIESFESISHLCDSWQKNVRRIQATYFATSKSPLTKRELELARLAISGKKYKEIAEILGIAPSTVKRAFATMYAKLGIKGQFELKTYLQKYDNRNID